MESIINAVRGFAADEEGAQIVEYSLIIAVISILLILALKVLTESDFKTFVSKVGTCLTTPASCGT